LPPSERRRIVHRILPFWEVHRFRISPQAHAAIDRQLKNRVLKIERGTVRSMDVDNDAFSVVLRTRERHSEMRSYDAIVVCSGPTKHFGGDPLLADAIARGFARMDDAKLGLDVDSLGQVRDAIGPMTRGRFGEMTGAPDIARHIERIARRFDSFRRSRGSRPRNEARSPNCLISSERNILLQAFRTFYVDPIK
jgi:uncharacterized NAD(P)/FAD-binding protein YdhS